MRRRRPDLSCAGILIPVVALVAASFALFVLGESFFEGCDEHCADENHEICTCAHCANSPRLADQSFPVAPADQGTHFPLCSRGTAVPEQLWIHAIDHPPRISC